MELAVIYARVSTTDQAQNGISLQAQTLNCRRYAEVQNLKVIGVEVDILSAKNTKRPALQRVMKLVHNKKVQHLIVWNIDRLTRNLVDSRMMHEKFGKKGAVIHEAEKGRARERKTSESRLFDDIEMLIKEFERAKISDRTKMAMAAKKAENKKISSRPPYGCRFDGDSVIEDAREQAIIKRVVFLKQSKISERKISAMLASENIFSRTGKPFTQGAIRNIITNAL